MAQKMFIYWWKMARLRKGILKERQNNPDYVDYIYILIFSCKFNNFALGSSM
jgi:hypothetical protein